MTIKADKKLLYTAIFLGVIALGLSFVVIRKASTVKTVELLAAGRNIRYGQTIQDRDLVEVSILIPGGNLLDRHYLSKRRFASLKGRNAQADISTGELITEAAIGLGSIEVDPNSLGQNERLISIQVDELSSVGYRVHRGDRIDIYPSNAVEPRPILECVEVMAVGAETQTRSSGGASYRTIVLKVTKEHAETILQAQTTVQRFRITLRSPQHCP